MNKKKKSIKKKQSIMATKPVMLFTNSVPDGYVQVPGLFKSFEGKDISVFKTKTSNGEPSRAFHAIFPYEEDNKARTLSVFGSTIEECKLMIDAAVYNKDSSDYSTLYPGEVNIANKTPFVIFVASKLLIPDAKTFKAFFVIDGKLTTIYERTLEKCIASVEEATKDNVTAELSLPEGDSPLSKAEVTRNYKAVKGNYMVSGHDVFGFKASGPAPKTKVYKATFMLNNTLEKTFGKDLMTCLDKAKKIIAKKTKSKKLDEKVSDWTEPEYDDELILGYRSTMSENLNKPEGSLRKFKCTHAVYGFTTYGRTRPEARYRMRTVIKNYESKKKREMSKRLEERNDVIMTADKTRLSNTIRNAAESMATPSRSKQSFIPSLAKTVKKTVEYTVEKEPLSELSKFEDDRNTYNVVICPICKNDILHLQREGEHKGLYYCSSCDAFTRRPLSAVVLIHSSELEDKSRPNIEVGTYIKVWDKDDEHTLAEAHPFHSFTNNDRVAVTMPNGAIIEFDYWARVESTRIIFGESK